MSFGFNSQVYDGQLIWTALFRHTFASDMVRAGISLPALMQLMGHANIQTTLVYMQVTPLEVYQQYARAIGQHIRPVPVTRP